MSQHIYINDVIIEGKKKQSACRSKREEEDEGLLYEQELGCV